MVNEAAIISDLGQPIGCPVRFTCADAVGIEKGALLWYYDPVTVSGASCNANLDAAKGDFAGIAATEKVASDGSTTIGCLTKGIFDLTTVAAPTVNCGDYLVISGQNLVARATVSSLSGARILGQALETASASEVIQVAVGVY